MLKRFLILALCVIMLFCLGACGQKEEDYKAKLISVMNEQEKSTVKDVFSFDFERAYVFNFEDGYMDGDSFAKEYNLDISISQVEDGFADYIQRIVFVDKSGSFVYVFKCDCDDVFFVNKGVVIYPETIIERKSSPNEEILNISFDSSEKFGSENTD